MHPAITLALAACCITYALILLSSKHQKTALKIFPYLLAFTFGMVVMEAVV